MGVKAFRINIPGLSNKVHEFHYEFGNEFFGQYGTSVVSEGKFTADVKFDKHETFIEVTFKVSGQARVICDRSLDPFDHPVKFEKKIIFKYGDADEELSDEIVMIHRDSDHVELGQYIYEFIILEIPLKKLHPRYAGELDDNEEGKIIYTSGDQSSDSDSGEDIDPRWEKLKKLK